MTGNTESGLLREGQLQTGLSKGLTGVRFCCVHPRNVNTSDTSDRARTIERTIDGIPGSATSSE